ncbi:low molecular weight protein arginine phosphatase [Paenibacillus sacheonensis]|uniref:Low molecular weight protein arginine phosphatase n=1 Tax=Paenibacillus sacheonensis TaxID=742054 RepID=A0A7X5C1U3_9BACL|nr:low molecular weight protein arginine phosphatase [Paenibacillus sacheonensis]MBM7566550.1 protein-tyrosine phosphatase [Paenibacillus sacheonensis]NBC73051.1 low molecular weight protein arginine phosphatase [Paenibacillus sacheonensis]
MKRILFVCTGNTCRSPMAEAMLRSLAQKRGVSLEVRSAGVSTVDGLPVSTNAQSVLRRRDIHHNNGSTALESGSITWADLILTMTASHKRHLLQRFPAAVDKTHTLLEFVHQDEEGQRRIAELESLYTDFQMKQALGGQLTDAERRRLLELEAGIPSFDIADPFGGSVQIYEESAAEIEKALHKLLDRLQQRK